MILKSHMHITNQCAPWKFANGVENPAFAGAVSLDGYLLQIPWWVRHKSLQTY
jgi:hypothetical protein